MAIGRRRRAEVPIPAEKKRRRTDPIPVEAPVDIMFEILLRVPVKSLAKCRCVCKQWFSLISDETFQENYIRHRSELDDRLLIIRQEMDENSLTTRLHLSAYSNQGNFLKSFSQTVPLNSAYSGIYCQIQSCLGLVCIAPQVYMDDNRILLCDPSAEKVIALPPTEGVTACIGFGYVTSTNQFKVVRFFSSQEDLDSSLDDSCDVFTLGASNWRKVSCTFPPHFSYSFEHGAAPFLHGALHLMSATEDYPEEDDCIYAFDLEKEDFSTISLPGYYFSQEPWLRSLRGTFLRAIEGLLYLIFYYKTDLEVWCLQDYHRREWVKVQSIDLGSFGMDVCADLLGTTTNGNLLLSIFDSLYSYNSHDKTFTKQAEENCSTMIFSDIEEFCILFV